MSESVLSIYLHQLLRLRALIDAGAGESALETLRDDMDVTWRRLTAEEVEAVRAVGAALNGARKPCDCRKSHAEQGRGPMSNDNPTGEAPADGLREGWVEGLPTVAQVREHEARGGWWQVALVGVPAIQMWCVAGWRDASSLREAAARWAGRVPTVHGWGATLDGVRFRPVTKEGTPIEFQVRGDLESAHREISRLRGALAEVEAERDEWQAYAQILTEVNDLLTSGLDDSRLSAIIAPGTALYCKRLTDERDAAREALAVAEQERDEARAALERIAATARQALSLSASSPTEPSKP